MTIDEIKELIQVAHDTGIAELEVQRGDNRVRIRRSISAASQEILITPAAMASAQTSSPGNTGYGTETPGTSPRPATDDKNTLVKSPIVGTYYDAPSPGSSPFVKVGDQVEPGKVLCIIESMKLMNEIEAEIAGTIVAKLVENGRPVEYGEALFTIHPR